MHKLSLKLGKYFYLNYYYLTIVWSILMFLVFLKINYFCCLEKLNFIDDINTFSIILLLYFILIGGLFVYFSVNIEKEEYQIMDKDNSTTIQKVINKDNIKIIVLPLFYIWFFSLSKIIVVVYKLLGSQNYSNFDIFSLIVWLIFLMATFCYWFKLKYKANTKQRFNIGYATLIIVYTCIIIFWDDLVPYIKNLLLLKKCIVSKIMEL
ncbi:MAG: hypothetical protein DRG11_05855 [Epsilonproteobacteria bacterium]|nr:MAG: hypothetical protein DRG11_05855 [Campylobacterota bacterium]